MPENQFTLEDLTTILVDRIGLAQDDVPDVPDASFADLGLDSLAVVEVQLAIQQQYGFVVPDEDAERIVTLRDAIDYVNLRLAEIEGLPVSARVDNAIVISAPIELVWEAMNEVEKWPELFTEYASAEILQRDGNTVRFRLTTHPDPEHGNQVWSWVSERTVDPVARSVRAHRIETGPFQFMNIEWEFKEAGAGTRMRWVQEFTMRPEAPADDVQATDYLNRNTRIQMVAIKERLEGSAAVTAR